MSDAVMIAMISAVGSTITAGIAAWGAYQSRSTHKLINSRMDELLALTKTEAFTAGERASNERAAAAAGKPGP